MYKAIPLVNLLTVMFITWFGQVVVSWVKTMVSDAVDGGTKVESLNTCTENPTCLFTAEKQEYVTE